MRARLPKGYSNSGGGGNMQQMIRQAQKMQDDMAAKQAELDEQTYTTTAGGGVVSVSITGKKEITNISLKPEIVDPDDIEMLTDLVTAAVNEAIRKVEDTNAQEMEKITGGLGSGMGIPGL